MGSFAQMLGCKSSGHLAKSTGGLTVYQMPFGYKLEKRAAYCSSSGGGGLALDIEVILVGQVL